MPKAKQPKIPETAVLSIEDIRKLLTPAQKKKNNLKEKTEEQKAAMLIRMKNMREKSLESRSNKKNSIHGGTPSSPTASGNCIEKPHLETIPIVVGGSGKSTQDETFILFEKKYNSKMEKLDDTMSQINTSLNEINQRKKEKYEKKQRGHPDIPDSKLELQATPIQATPIQATPIPQSTPRSIPIATPIAIATPQLSIPFNPNRIMKSTFNKGLFNKR